MLIRNRCGREDRNLFLYSVDKKSIMLLGSEREGTMARMNELLLEVAEVLDVPTTSDTAVEVGQRILDRVPKDPGESIAGWVRRGIVLVGIPKAPGPSTPRTEADLCSYLWGMN